jgi:hypothetical protein
MESVLRFVKRVLCALPLLGRHFAPYVGLAHRPGFFYSPIPDLNEIKAREHEIWQHERDRSLFGIEVHEASQLQLLECLMPYYKELPFTEHKRTELRYFFENDFFSYSDGIFYYCMLRHLKPNRVIEIGSGFSSCVLLDTNEIFLGSKARCTFIEPDPERLYSLLKPGDRERHTIIPRRLQDVSLNEFSELSSGDILFVDSSHVSKTGSELNVLLFEILPSLRAGVYVHFHDAFWPFEYPRDYVYAGWAWNELYLLRAFLSYNRTFSIALFPPFIERFHREKLEGTMPLVLRNPPGWPTLQGASLWLRREEA